MIWPFLLAVLSIYSPQAGAQDPRNSHCMSCHLAKDSKLLHAFEGSVHGIAGIGCIGCHGGDPGGETKEDGHLRSKGYSGVLKRRDIPALCGSCHGDEAEMRKVRLDFRVYEDWKRSKHGRLAAKGDPRVPICSDCHGDHGILSRLDPASPTHRRNIAGTCGSCHSDPVKMGASKLPTNQEKEYREGIHGEILYGKRKGNPNLVPTCIDCHGGHGAVPPTARSVPEVCGSCHFEERRFLAQSPHAESLRFTGEPSCKDCHGNHHNTIPEEGLQEKVCIPCHNDPKDVGTREAKAFASLLARGGQALGRLDKALEEAQAREPSSLVSMLLEAEWKRAETAYSTLRKESHTLNRPIVSKAVEDLESIVRTVLAVAENGIDREKGFSETVTMMILIGVGSGLLVASVVVVLLLLRILGRGKDRKAVKAGDS